MSKVNFVSKVSKSGNRRLISIPKEILKENDFTDNYYKIYLSPVNFTGIKQEKYLAFVGKISKSGNRRLINIPKGIREDIDENTEYYKVYIFSIRFDDLDKL